MLLHLPDPLINRLEALEVSDGVADEGTHGSPVVCLSDRIVLLLPCSVVELYIETFLDRMINILC